jgi:hypothetical protein
MRSKDLYRAYLRTGAMATELRSIQGTVFDLLPDSHTQLIYATVDLLGAIESVFHDAYDAAQEINND